MKPIGPRRLPLPTQAELLKKHFPFGTCWLALDRLYWVGSLTPSDLSPSYTVRVKYDGRARADVTVIDPVLAKRDGRLPHVFPGDRLCLHVPQEWDVSMPLATTIIPWAAEWLYHYELWLPTGVWQGGGHEPSSGRRRGVAYYARAADDR